MTRTGWWVEVRRIWSESLTSSSVNVGEEEDVKWEEERVERKGVDAAEVLLVGWVGVVVEGRWWWCEEGDLMACRKDRSRGFAKPPSPDDGVLRGCTAR